MSSPFDFATRNPSSRDNNVVPSPRTKARRRASTAAEADARGESLQMLFCRDTPPPTSSHKRSSPADLKISSSTPRKRLPHSCSVFEGVFDSASTAPVRAPPAPSPKRSLKPPPPRMPQGTAVIRGKPTGNSATHRIGRSNLDRDDNGNRPSPNGTIQKESGRRCHQRFDTDNAAVSQDEGKRAPSMEVVAHAAAMKQRIAKSSREAHDNRNDPSAFNTTSKIGYTRSSPSRGHASDGDGLVLQRRNTPRKARSSADSRWTEVVVPAQMLLGEIRHCRATLQGAGTHMAPEVDRALDAWYGNVAKRLVGQNQLVLQNIEAVHQEKLVCRHVETTRGELIRAKACVRRLKQEFRRLKSQVEEKKASNANRQVASRFLDALDRLRR